MGATTFGAEATLLVSSYLGPREDLTSSVASLPNVHNNVGHKKRALGLQKKRATILSDPSSLCLR